MEPPNESYTLGWISALPIELAAATLMLDVEHACCSIAADDKNTYVTGQIAGHNVVMTCLPQGTIGGSIAAAAVTHMVRSFSKLRFVLLVGVGAGAPSMNKQDAEKDIFLGDVVVSMPEGIYGGVIQYDMGKRLPTNEFQRTGSLNKPATILRSAASTLHARQLAGKHILNDKVVSFLGQPNVRRRFQRPPEARDMLFDAEYQHACSDQEDCAGCDHTRLAVRAKRESTIPVVHYGPIASANQVVRDARCRDDLRQRFGVLCLEMEAAGVIDNYPSLIIRGICDYADSHKNKRWQPYAALTAAAYAKELLSIIRPVAVQNAKVVQQVEDATTHRLLTEVNSTTEEIRQISSRILDLNFQEHEKTYIQKFLHTLCVCSEYETYKNYNPLPAPGTCVWVSNHFLYRQWRDSKKNDLLWISADPGCGKSVLARSLVDQYSTEKDSQLTCYFFFKDNERQNQLVQALCSILHQIFGHLNELLFIEIVEEVWKKYGEALAGNVEELWRLLLATCAACTTHDVVCILDALDECNIPDQKRLIEKLSQFYVNTAQTTTHSKRLKFLVTSRPYDSIGQTFRIPKDLPAIRLRGEEENEQIHEEINLVIDHDVDLLSNDLKLQRPIQETLRTTLKNMQHRTYLWLHLAKEDIRQTYRNSLRPDDVIINTVPKTVEEAYEKILNRIPKQNRTLVRQILQMMVGAQRPLKATEMAAALELQNPSDRYTPIDPDHLTRNIRNWCELFVFINDEGIHLIHQTAKEFLLTEDVKAGSHTWRHAFTVVKTNYLMAHICSELIKAKYLHNSVQPYTEGRTDIANIDLKCQYAVEYWADHVRRSEPQFTEKHLDLVLAISHLFRKQRNWLHKYVFQDLLGNRFRGSNVLHIAALHGHQTLVQHLLSTSALDLNGSDVVGRTPLYWACHRGWLGMVQLLLKQPGIKVNYSQATGETPLYTAAERGHQMVVQLLLEHPDVDVICRTKQLQESLNARLLPRDIAR